MLFSHNDLNNMLMSFKFVYNEAKNDFYDRFYKRKQYLEMDKKDDNNSGHSVSVSYGSAATVESADKVSICNLTNEAFPRISNYTNGARYKRPSLSELHRGSVTNGSVPKKADLESEPKKEAFKLGWIQGVFIPCLLNIWGVMLFLRVPWVVSQSGIFESIIIIGISTFVCILTTLSLSALCTNGEVKGGGIYFIISRSLGPEFGASVGVVLVFANAVSASMNTIGFCDSFNNLLDKYYHTKIIDGGVNDVRLVGIIAIVLMIVICATGIEWESKAQNFLIAIIVAAMVDFFVGAVRGPITSDQEAKGFKGFSWDLLKANWNADYKPSVDLPNPSFFAVFAIFFPSVTGIQAGANISGDLKDPGKAIPKGTLLSLLISMASYAAIVIVSGATSTRYAILPNCTENCNYGLHDDYYIMQIISIWPFLIYLGCFAATLSTALTNLLTVPRLLQALGEDRIYPGLSFFAKTYKGEPMRGYVLTFVISAIFVLLANLNQIAPLISNFYLASYALINFCTFHAALVKPLGWRPTFKCYNTWISLFGCLICLLIMFLIDWITSLITFIIFFALYLLVVYREPDVNWGSSNQAQMYKTALTSSLRLATVDEHVKNYNPQILVLSGSPQTRLPLIHLANLITKNNALLICADIVKEKLSYKRRHNLLNDYTSMLCERKIKGFYCVVDGLKFEEAAKGVMQCCGIGKLKPNVVMMGYKNDWNTVPEPQLQNYFNVLHNAFDNRLGVCILRLGDRMDFSDVIVRAEQGDDNPGYQNSPNGSTNDLRSITIVDLPTESPRTPKRTYNVNHNGLKVSCSSKKNSRKRVLKILSRYPDGREIEKDVINKVTMFNRKHEKGTIDVWWIYDDGGLTMLLPYILSTRTQWMNCQLRIFALTSNKDQLESEERSMADLLSKFRINYSSLKMFSDADELITPSVSKSFEELIQPFRSNPSSDSYVSDEELNSLLEKTKRQLKLKELLKRHSSDATLIVMSLPMPRKGVVSAAMYMAWLEVLTKDMPPFLLVRGNQTSVLTFYS